jgi:ADP-ribose pyrophosphatase YjhB (NUDIX family)
MSIHHIRNKDYYQSLPKKRLAIGALIFYREQLLILKPTYTQDPLDQPLVRNWILPGGIVEAEESPEEALRREIKAQLEIEVEPTRLITVDYIHNIDVRGEYVYFLFETKALSESQAQKTKPLAEEIKDYKFVDIEKALMILNTNAARRIESALISMQDGINVNYLEDGNSPFFKADIDFS